MGSKISLCEAITTPDVYVKLDTPQNELQTKDFYTKFPSISKIIAQKYHHKTQPITKKHPATKFPQGIYIGPINSNQLPHSSFLSQEGIFIYDQGFLYVGEMKNGKRHGVGVLINQDGEYYVGEWSENNPNGIGEYLSTQSSKSYKGNWLNGIQNGHGIQKYQDNSTYSGQFVNGLKHGRGRFQYPDGTYYQGQFKQNSISGNGICSGKFHKYQGQWQNGKMHGNGISTWNDQNGNVIGSYVGQYKEGLKHGYGEYRWGEKKIYKGKWEEGDMSSQGVLLNYQA